MNDAVGLEDVGDGDIRNAALFVLDGDAVFAVGHDEQLSASDGLEFGGTVASLNGLFEILGGEAAGYYVIRQHFRERVFIFGLEERVHGAGGKFCEGVIRWSEYREWASGLERVDEAGGFHRGDERGVVLGIDGVVDDVLGRVHRRAADHGVFHFLRGRDGSADKGKCRQCENCEELFHFRDFPFPQFVIGLVPG